MSHEMECPKRLNVVFHGLVGMVFNNRCIEVVVPRIDDHVYVAGTWTMEMELRDQERYHLEGVCFGNANPATTGGIFFKRNACINRGREFLRNSLFMPYPAVITPLRLAYVPVGTFSGADADPNLTQIPLVTVFTYDISDYCGLSLEPLGWKREPQPGRENYVNLHVFADPVHDHRGHVHHAFEKAICVHPGLDFHVANTRTTAPSPTCSVPGLPLFQLQTLCERCGHDTISKLVKTLPDEERSTIEKLIGDVSPFTPGDVQNCPNYGMDNRGA